MLRSIILGVILSVILISSSCTKHTTARPRLIFKMVYDSTQVRLDSFGNPKPMPAGHAGQNPQMNVLSAHYIELAPTMYTALGAGAVLYKTPTTTQGGASAIDFTKEPLTPNNGTVYSVELDSVTPGTYQWLRVSLAYQNYNVQLYYDTTINYNYQGTNYPIVINQEFPCTVASFVGYNTYISSYNVNTEGFTINANKLQGYWGFESQGTLNIPVGGFTYPYTYNWLSQGQAPPGSTTVVNPLFATSPIPDGSCVATGQFMSAQNRTQSTTLTITGKETNDIVVTVSLSTNHSFEWVEVNADGKWQPTIGENIVDMGIRGVIPYVQQ